MPFKFPYKLIPGPNNTSTPRPVVPIKIGLAEDSLLGVFALIDSGADICLFAGELGEEIGIEDITTGVRGTIRGVVEGAQAEYFIHPVIVNVGGWSHKMDVGFMPELQRIGYGVLGHRGFFQNFSVKFDLRKGEVELKKYE